MRRDSLANFARRLGLGDYLLLGKGEEQSGGREKPSILADALEAVIGAVHIDAGRAAAARVVMTLLGSRIEVGCGRGELRSQYIVRLHERTGRRREALNVRH